MGKKQKQTHPEVGEDATQYGEFVSTYFAWIPLSKQKERAREMEDMTKKERRQAIDEAYYNLEKKLKKNTKKYLDKYGDTLMRDMHIRDDLGVKDAVKKALTDTSGLPLLNSLMGWKDDTGRFSYVADHY